MKFYDFALAPSPRKVRIFISEKRLDMPTVTVNLREGEQRTEVFAVKNANRTVPVLELDDGTCLTESLAICHYLEQLHPDPNLMGSDAKEQALVLMWNDIATLQGYLGIQEVFRNSAKAMKDRALPGPQAYEQIPELVTRGRKRTEVFFDQIERRLGESPYLAGDRYTYADIAGYVYAGFATAVAKIDPAESRNNVRRWMSAIAARPAIAELGT